MGLSEHDYAHLNDIFNVGYGDWFTAHLMRLIQKADRDNLEKIRKGFPEEVATYERWLTSSPS